MVLRDAAERLAVVQARMEKACKAAGRDVSEITLVGACKRQPVNKIAASLFAGLRNLGENYIQGAEATQITLPQFLSEPSNGTPPPLPRWHMIGHLQRNKAKQAVENFETVDSLDSPRLAKALHRRAEELNRTIEVCIQVNLSGESTKSGTSPAELPELISTLAELSRVRAIGLMTMPAPGTVASRHDFAELRELRDQLRDQPGCESLTELNMGMSGDLEIAIKEGATIVRIGTDLFGERKTPSE